MKKFILSLFVLFVGIISFCSAGSYSISGQLVGYIGGSNIPVPTKVYSNNGTSTPRVYYTCFFSCDDIYANMKLYKVVGGSEFGIGSYFYCNSTKVFSIEATAYLLRLDGGSSSYVVNYVCTITGDNIGSTCPTCPEINTGAILSGYVPESQLNICENNYNNCQSDLNSCQSNTSGFNDLLNSCNNNLNACNSSLTNCLQYNCPDTELSFSKFYVRHGESSWSQLTGMENYYVYLPEYLGYNYEYSNGTDLNFTVGVGYDTGYLSDVVNIQNYQPTSDDFSKLVGLFGSYGGLLIACLFVIIVFYLIKKMFK